MARPSKARRVCHNPGHFNITNDKKFKSEDILIMTIDEYEAIRLIDHQGESQEECARQMNVARTTAQAIYNCAREKLAQCLIEGKTLHVEGGNISYCNGSAGCPECASTK